jgi:hypothetical protein
VRSLVYARAVEERLERADMLGTVAAPAHRPGRTVVCEAARSNKAAKTKTKMATVLPLFRPKHK